ncbi:GntR family transcriptional regulator [Enterococcus hulanensis]|uniref:GntR family transcriptional regulator n=1 Tax=Enterococcus hulanensis TaxID=2559929 RepID=A0ABU3F344_9ENTE|nr:GntR family transcriptional regulator [Enterococcus hulanensis]MDT2601544.1 GntR family transcriptional regulator [Enterococcus hulanensis]MDT2610913.1 GntR family transcriptional regulator [Enterococcus hulanensis]MDT2618318.1 GntR family transcriptional regulator [Enterococcus hulanensis]MDT2629479.1 GntR family transcriptional regulator [Enterococcus hulanensis]MDT2657041.1 GntR family transcriptional regulator [Enterococcus hulanensis]
MAIPKYQLIKDELKQQIISGKFENGDKFYTEAELAEMFKVSSITVIRALNDLVKDGFIVRHQGRGSFVSRARKGKLVEFSDIELFPISHDQVKVLSIERGNDPKFLSKLGLPDTVFYYCIERLRTTKGIPYIYQRTYLPEQYVNSNYPDLSYYNSIYQRFKLDYNIHMNEEDFTETNEIKFPTPAEKAEKLRIPVDEPTVLQVRVTKRKETQQILEYVESYKKWNFYKIELVSKNT